MTDFAVNLIRVVNELQDKLNPLVADNLAFDLPQIAVIGGQSSGKSSVLESFVGRDFLPRGSGVVTRRPLVLQLINCKTETKAFGEFLHIPGKRFHDFNEIRDEITNETDREVKNSYGISSKPINLKIYSSEVLDLTLIDLPGMTRIAVGNQPKDIEMRIESMILEYIEKETCLILAVTAANQDLATSDALKLAEKVDPEGKRTIGVLTKLDLMDRGTDARDILLGKLLPLRLGYIGVVNRSQQDIDMRKDMRRALADEHEFFAKHQSYKDIAGRQGIGYLQKYLHKELSKHIFKLLPPLKQKFESEVFDINRSLEKIHFPNDTIDKEMIVSESHQQFCQHFKSALLGEGADIDLTKLSGGAKIGTIFNKTFAKTITELVYDQKLLNSNISTAIQNSFGVYYELFIPNTAIKAVIRSQIETFREPSLNCIDLITREIEAIVQESVDKIQNIPNLRELFTKLSLDCVRKSKIKCCDTVLNFIRAEKSYINLSVINSELAKNKNSIEQSKPAEASTSTAEERTLVSTYVVIDNSTSGWIRFQGNDFWFVLVDKTLTWFKDQTKNEQKGSVDLKDAEFKYFPNDFKVVLILLQKNASTEMELKFGLKKSAEHWKQWFEKLGVKPYFTPCAGDSTVSQSSPDTSMTTDDNESQYPEHLRPQVRLMKELVDRHQNVMKIKFKEQIPKMCSLELIDSMVNFVEVELIPQIRQSISSIDEIIGEDPFKGLRNELNERRKHYTEAIEIIDRFSRHNS